MFHFVFLAASLNCGLFWNLFGWLVLDKMLPSFARVAILVLKVVVVVDVV